MPYEVIDLRQFKASALDSLLRAEAQEWEERLHWDYAASRRLIVHCLDEQRLAGYALREKEGISAYSFFFYEGEKGMIGNLFAGSGAERIERAAVLLRHVLETLLATPGLARVEAQLPHFTLEELAPTFRERQFEVYLRRFMILPLARHRQSLYGQSAPGVERPALRPFRFVPWDRRHDRAVAEVIYNAYRGHIDARINDQYSSLAGTTHLVASILEQRGCGELLPSASLVAVYQPTGRVVAALAVTAVRARTAHIPQVAVAVEFQSAGLGTALLETAFQTLAAQGFEEVSLTVTDLNADAVRLYERLDFQTIRTFGAFTWESQQYAL